MAQEADQPPKLSVGLYASPQLTIDNGLGLIEGYQISPILFIHTSARIQLGIAPYFMHRTVKNIVSYDSQGDSFYPVKSKIFGLNFQFRYNLSTSPNGAYVMAYGGPGFSTTKTELINNPTRNEYFSYSAGIGAGYKFELNNSLLLDTGLNFGVIGNQESGIDNYQFLSLSFGLIKRLK